MQFKINHSDIKLLEDAVKDFRLLHKLRNAEQGGEHIEKGKYPTGRYFLDLSESETGLMLDALSDMFMDSGVDENGNPNSAGRKLEALIDIFNK